VSESDPLSIAELGAYGPVWSENRVQRCVRKS
jgi:hypothetical protein